jgi:hypothetical protein
MVAFALPIAHGDWLSSTSAQRMIGKAAHTTEPALTGPVQRTRRPAWQCGDAALPLVDSGFVTNIGTGSRKSGGLSRPRRNSPEFPYQENRISPLQRSSPSEQLAPRCQLGTLLQELAHRRHGVTSITVAGPGARASVVIENSSSPENRGIGQGEKQAQEQSLHRGLRGTSEDSGAGNICAVSAQFPRNP